MNDFVSKYKKKGERGRGKGEGGVRVISVCPATFLRAGLGSLKRTFNKATKCQGGNWCYRCKVIIGRKEQLNKGRASFVK